MGVGRCQSSSTSTCTPSTRCSTAPAGSARCSTGRRAEDARRRRDRARQHVLGGHLPRRRRASAASSRSSAARSTSRPAAGTTKSGTPGETANHLVLLAETNEGFHNLIKLVSAGYTEGFYYKPRIDKDLLATARARADRPEQLPQGRGGHRHPHRPGPKGRRGRGHVPRHARPGQLLPRDAGPGHRRSRRIVNTGLPADRAGSRTCRWCARTTSTTCARPTSTRTTCCCASARARASATRSACGTTATSSS